MHRVYFDHNATTPVDRRVLEAMLPFFADEFGNASSIHSFGQRTRAAVVGPDRLGAGGERARPALIVVPRERARAVHQGLFEVGVAGPWHFRVESQRAVV